MAPWYLFAWQFYGSPIPNSLFAKAAAYNEQFHSFRHSLRAFWFHIGPAGNGFGADGFKGVSCLLAPASPRPRVPVFRLPRSAFWLAAGGLLLAVHSGVWCARTAEYARRLQWAENHVRRDIGLWLNRHAAPAARVATEPIGHIGYYSQRRILDEVGLVSPGMIPLNRAGDGWFGSMVRQERPEYVVERAHYLTRNATLFTHRRMFAGEADRQWFASHYRRVKRYPPALVERLGVSRTTAINYGFVIFARRDQAIAQVPDTARSWAPDGRPTRTLRAGTESPAGTEPRP
jgi:hypothetical protein